MTNLLDPNIRKYWLVPLVLILVLLVLLIQPLMTLTLGETYILKVEPVDPTDAFRGDYIVIAYQTESFDQALVPASLLEDSSYWYRPVVYVTFQPSASGLTSEVAAISLVEPRGDIPYVEANLYKEWIYDSDQVGGSRGGEIRKPTDENGHMVYRLDFPMERFYVKENTGRVFEDAAREGQLLATIKVWRGYSLITDVTIDQ